MEKIRHPQFMGIINVVGSVVSLFETVLTTCTDFRHGRRTATNAKRGSRALPRHANSKQGPKGQDGCPRN